MQDNFQYKNPELLKLFSKYKFSDLVCAVFCLSSWRDNRSIVKTSLTMNHALNDYAFSGDTPISSYDDLANFYGLLKDMFPITYEDDLIVNDFGEVKVKYDDEVYPIIIGNGYEYTYEVIHFAIEAAEKAGKTSILLDALEYSRNMIESLENYNLSAYVDEEITFDLPSEDYFNAVKQYLESINLEEHSEEFIKSLAAEKVPVEEAHFVIKNTQIYPLFNASLIIDVYKYFLSLLEEKQIIDVSQETIWKTVHNNFDVFSSKNPKVIFPAQIANDDIHDQIYFTFVAPVDYALIIAFNSDIFPEEYIERDIERLKKHHKSGELVISEIAGSNEKCLATRVSKEDKLFVIGYDSYTDLTQFKVGALDGLPYTSMSTLDLLLILNDIEHFSELYGFLDFMDSKQVNRFLTMSGISGLYLLYKAMHGLISEGAINYTMLSVSHDFPSRHTYDKFTKDYKDFPFNITSNMFENPHLWQVKECDFGFTGYANKSEFGFFGYGTKIGNNGFVFLTHNATFIQNLNMPEGFFEQIKTIDELNQRPFQRYMSFLENIEPFNNSCVQFLYMPYEHASKIDRTGFTRDPQVKYVYSECNCSCPEHIVVRYTVNIEQLFSDIMAVENRSVENIYFKELIRSLEGIMGQNKALLFEQIDKDNSRKKTVDIFELLIEYRFDRNVSFSMPSEGSFRSARKEIAKICRDSNIDPGNYEQQAARDIVRKMQVELIKEFESRIAEFNKVALHQMALNHLAFLTFEREISRDRFSNQINIEDDLAVEFRKTAMDMREKAKRNIRSVLYLIESNLFVERKHNQVNPQRLDYDFLLAFADWLVVLQDDSDMAHFGSDWIGFEVTSQFNVNTILNDQAEAKVNEIINRRYNYPDYSRKGDTTDQQYVARVAEAFEKDLGFSLSLFYDILRYLKWHFADNTSFTQVSENIVSINKLNLISDIIAILGDESEREMITKVLDYLTIDGKELKTCGGKTHPILPIWEREKRNNRFDQKPLVLTKDEFIYSPIVVESLFQLWWNGIPDFYPPYEIGLDNTLVILEEWKKRYEDLMVTDLCNIFKASALKHIFPNMKLHRIDKKGNHPTYLGDYDLIAIDEMKGVIWNIESKVLRKVGSLFEDHMQQKGFFEQHKFDERFQRRIDYLESNYMSILRALNLDYTKEYEVKSYMVTNKIFVAKVKKIGFPILAYSEMKELVEDFYRN